MNYAYPTMSYLNLFPHGAGRYLSNLSSSSEGSLGRLEESETSSRSTRARSTRCQKIRRKFNKCMNCFLKGGGSCSYDDETVGDIDVPLRYQHLVKQWVPSDLSQVNIDFCVNERIYRIAPSPLHGLGLFCMDGIKIGYDRCTESMEYVGPSYNYNDWMCLVQYTWSMCRYGLSANYIQLKDKDQNKGSKLYIDGMPKITGNIARFINSTQPGSTLKQPNCIFESREVKRVFVCAIKSIVAAEELLINYNLNRVGTNMVSMVVVHLTNLPKLLLIILTSL